MNWLICMVDAGNHLPHFWHMPAHVLCGSFAPGWLSGIDEPTELFLCFLCPGSPKATICLSHSGKDDHCKGFTASTNPGKCRNSMVFCIMTGQPTPP